MVLIQLKKSNNMKIDFQKLKETEAQFCTPHQLPGDLQVSADLSLFTLQRMIKVVLEYNESSYTHAPSNVRLAFETLKSLGIIVESPSINVQQLNS